MKERKTPVEKIYRTFLQFTPDIDEICVPLKRLGVTYVSYMKNFKNHKQIYLSNSNDWIKCYYDNALYRSSLFHGSPTIYSSGYYLWPPYSKKEVFSFGRNNFNSDNGITFIEKQKDSCEFFFFSGDSNNIGLVNLFINNIDLLKRFTIYFKDKANKILRLAERNKILLTEHYNDWVSNDCEFNLISNATTKCYRDLFIDTTKIKKYPIIIERREVITLSAREIDCALGLLEGKTSKEIANKLRVSTRSIEAYLENLKLKLNCYKKSELIDILLKNNLNKIAW